MSDDNTRLTRLELAVVHIGNIVLNSRRKSNLANPDTERDEQQLEGLLEGILEDAPDLHVRRVDVDLPDGRRGEAGGARRR